MQRQCKDKTPTSNIGSPWGWCRRPTVARLLLPAPHLTGDSRGYVDVYKIVGVDLTPDMTREEQVERLRQSVMTTDHEGSTSKV